MRTYDEITALEELIRSGQIPRDYLKKLPPIDPKSPGASMENPQRQPVVEVTASPIGGTTPIPKLTKQDDGVDSPISKYSEGYRQHINPAIEARIQQGIENREMTDKSAENIEFYKKERLKRIAELDSIPAPEKSPFTSLLADSRAAYEAIKPPEPNKWASLVADLAPVMLGLVGGQAGKRAALPGFKLAQDIKNKDRDAAITIYKEQKQGLKDNYSNLLSAEKAFQEEQLRKVDQALKVITAKIGAGEKLSDDEQHLFDKVSGYAQESEGKVVDDIEEGSKKIMDQDFADQKHKDEMAARKYEADKKAKAAAKGVKPDKPTEFQTKSAMNANMMMQSEEITKKLYQGGVLPSARSKFFRTIKDIDMGKFGNSTLSSYLEDHVRNRYSPAEYKKIKDQITAESTFLEAVGRVRSGAAISVGEWLGFRAPYFDNYGDNPQQSGQKRKLRESEMRQAKLGAGSAPIDYELNPQGRAGTVPESKTATVKPPPKVGEIKGGYRFKGGDPSKKDSWEKVK